MTATPKTAPVLALDIGNVCVAIDPQPLLEAIGFVDMADFRRFDAEGAVWGQIQAFEEGQMSLDAFRRWFVQIFPNLIEPDAVDAVWGMLLKEEIDGMAEVVGRVCDAGVKPVFLSDICPIRYAMVRRQLSFSSLVEDAVLSYEVGCHKPQQGIFEAMERDHCDGRVPLLYLDDLEDNVVAARARGWRAHRFESVEGLIDELDECLRSLH